MIDWRMADGSARTGEVADIDEIFTEGGFQLVDVREAIRRFNVGKPFRGLRPRDMYPGRGSGVGTLDLARHVILTLWPYTPGVVATGARLAAGSDLWRVSKAGLRRAVSRLLGAGADAVTIELVLPDRQGLVEFAVEGPEAPEGEPPFSAMVAIYVGVAQGKLPKRPSRVRGAYRWEPSRRRWEKVGSMPPDGPHRAPSRSSGGPGIGGGQSYGNARDLDYSHVAAWVPYRPGAVPDPGDIVVWDGLPADPRYGHTAIAFDGATPDRLVCFSQNWPPGSPCVAVQCTYEGVRGWWHPFVLHGGGVEGQR